VVGARVAVGTAVGASVGALVAVAGTGVAVASTIGAVVAVGAEAGAVVAVGGGAAVGVLPQAARTGRPVTTMAAVCKKRRRVIFELISLDIFPPSRTRYHE